MPLPSAGSSALAWRVPWTGLARADRQEKLRDDRSVRATRRMGGAAADACPAAVIGVPRHARRVVSGEALAERRV
ncbi:MAG TPA: hypothetical protein VIK04_05145 [Solirubrobacteraceae bacterium]